jgi:hypothetical protein
MIHSINFLGRRQSMIVEYIRYKIENEWQTEFEDTYEEVPVEDNFIILYIVGVILIEFND